MAVAPSNSDKMCVMHLQIERYMKTLVKALSSILRDNRAISLSEPAKKKILAHYLGQPAADPGYATVKDFCDSADFLPMAIRFGSDLKDVQRPWAIKSILGVMPIGSKILEIGGGEPIVSGILQQLGYDVTLIDPYEGSGNGPTQFDRYKWQYPKVKIIKALFEKDCESLKGNIFDCIFSVSVLEHIPTGNLNQFFEGIAQFLKEGGFSIHCLDDVVAGATSDWHFQEAREVLALQLQLGNPVLSLASAREITERKLRGLYAQLQNDVETYYLSPLEFYRWKGEKSYDEYSFCKIVSVQTCAIKR